MVSTTSTESVAGVVGRTARTLTTATVEILHGITRRPPPSGAKVLLEYVSANPNGPITAIHGRGGVLGDTLAALLAATGSDPTREFYVNDANSFRQMRQFARAVLHRYRQMFGQESWNGSALPVDAEGYPEEYVTHTTQKLIEAVGDRFLGRNDDETLLPLQETTARIIRQEQEEDLTALGIRFDRWFSESRLHADGAIERILESLRASGHTFEQGSALWLRSTDFGDEADRVLLRADGSPTYLAGDLAYHADKFDRGFDYLIDLWASDHAGYIERTRAGLAALGYDPKKLTVLLVGPVRLLRDGTEVKAMRTDGLLEVITLTELLTELSPEVVRWTLCDASSEEPLDLDADRLRRPDMPASLEKVRYARSSCRWAAENAGDAVDPEVFSELTKYPEVLREAADRLTPNRLTAYLAELSDRWVDSVRSGNRPAEPVTQAVTAVLDQGSKLLGIDIKDDNA